MFTVLTLCWLVCALATLTLVLLARRRREALARELHEVRGALTSARLAVDLLPILDVDNPSVCRAASDELERTYATLSDFERLLHERLLAPSISRERLADAASARQLRRLRFDAREELARLALIWGESARRQGRELVFTWQGPDDCVLVGGQQRHFTEVITNLLTNALRHGEGDVELIARIRSDHLRVEVCDAGPGLPGPLAGIARRPQRGEHGHGLSVARRASRALGGTLSSAPASLGARLVFTVPALHRPDQTVALAQSQWEGAE